MSFDFLIDELGNTVAVAGCRASSDVADQR